MRQITLRFSGECRKCGATLQTGETAIYERRVGVFCEPCAPADAEEIRSYRQEARERKAARYEEWAEKRREKASATLNHNREHYLSDWAFVTQPGRFPLRERVVRQQDRAYESLAVARKMEDKAARLRQTPRVKGDAAARDEAKREEVREWIKPGMMVDTCHCGIAKVIKVNRKTAKFEGRHGNFNHDLMFLSPANNAA